MSKEEVINKVNEFLVAEFEVNPQEISSDANLKDTLGLDSLDYVDLVVIIESTFGVKVKGEDFVKINNFNDLYDYIYINIQEKNQPVA